MLDLCAHRATDPEDAGITVGDDLLRTQLVGMLAERLEADEAHLRSLEREDLAHRRRQRIAVQIVRDIFFDNRNAAVRLGDDERARENGDAALGDAVAYAHRRGNLYVPRNM